MPTRSKVFISYRADEDGGRARVIYEPICRRFGAGRVFMYVTETRPADFVERISNAIAGSKVLLVVIGPRWTTVAKNGRPRIDDPGDFVRLEVEQALADPDVVVFPLLVGGARMPEPHELPESLRPLSHRFALDMRDETWDYDIGRLMAELERLIRPVPTGLLALVGVITAFLAGLLATGLVLDLLPSFGDTEEAVAGTLVVRRAVTWALVGAALAAAMALALRHGRQVASRAALGLLVGALAGALGGLIDALPVIADREFGSWLGVVALAATGGVIGALLGSCWEPPHRALGLAAGLAAGALAELVMSSPPNPGATSLRIALLVAGVLAALAALVAAQAAAERDTPARGVRRGRPA